MSRMEETELEEIFLHMAELMRIYAPNRLQHPLRRKGERGAGQWEEISWDEAIDEICTRWQQYQRDYGPGSIVFSDCACKSRQ